MAFLIRPRGLEPLTFGLGNQCSKDVKPCNGNNLHKELKAVPPVVPPQPFNSPELQFVLDRWESLPYDVREEVLSLVESAEI